MARPRKSTVEQVLDERTPLKEVVIETAKTVEEQEKDLLNRLARKYKDEESGERVPGKIVRGTKTIWTYQDMVARFPIATFTPEETIPLTWNGVKVQAHANIEMHVPKPFYDLYTAHRKEAANRKTPPGITVLVGYDGFQES